MQIFINRETNIVEGINCLPSIFNYTVNVLDEFNLFKQAEYVARQIALGTDEEGNIIYKDDVQTKSVSILTEPQYFTVDDIPLEAIKEYKIKELSTKCNEVISNGFYSDVKGEMHLYDFLLENQVNLKSLKDDAKDGFYPDGVPYYYKGGQCELYTLEEINKLYIDGATFKLTTVQKYKMLKEMVLNATSLEEVSNISWESI